MKKKKLYVRRLNVVCTYMQTYRLHLMKYNTWAYIAAKLMRTESEMEMEICSYVRSFVSQELLDEMWERLKRM